MNAEIAEAKAALRQEIRAEFASICAELAAVRERLDGAPLIGQSIESLRHDVRTLRADLTHMQTKQTELETRVLALEEKWKVVSPR
jgi:hypothetical protein